MTDIDLPYRARPAPTVFAVVVLCGCATVLSLLASRHEAIVLPKLVTVAPEPAARLMYALAGVFAAVVVLTLWGAFVGATNPPHFRLTAAGLDWPVSTLSSRAVHVPWDTVESVRIMRYPGRRWLILRRSGRKLALNTDRLPSSDDLDRVVAALRERLGPEKTRGLR